MTMRLRVSLVLLGAAGVSACAHNSSTSNGAQAPMASNSMNVAPIASVHPPTPDPRVGLKGGLTDAGQASWNLRLMSATPPSAKFVGSVNSDLAFRGNDVIQGNFNGFQVWDISNPSQPVLRTAYLCPASQSDISVYHNLLFVSSESGTGRLDCGTEGITAPVSAERLRGIRIFDATDIAHPKYVANVQTCRGSHTHTVVTDPKDPDDVYIYVSGSAPVRSASELAGCSNALPATDSNSAHFRIEVIKVPLAHPEQAAIVSSPRIFNDLAAPPTHGEAAADVKALDEARAKGAFIAEFDGQHFILPPTFVKPQLDSVVRARGGSGNPTAADSAAFRAYLPTLVNKLTGGARPRTGPDQCHDITVYPAIGLAGGACEGYGLLLDIHDPAHPVRLDAAADSNFSYWHSATFSNDGSKVLFSDEWGGGSAPKCRATDNMDWGADAIFSLVDGRMNFRSYYKMPAAQTSTENCVAHNGSLIPIPGRDVMVQAWYQGGISVFDWTDAAHPKEIAFFDRGPIDTTQLVLGGAWSAYWYNGAIVVSEIVRGLDIFELTPNPALTQNEIDAARTVHFDEYNVQDQQKFVWPPSFALARAYADQLQRSSGLSSSRLAAVRATLSRAEGGIGQARHDALLSLAQSLRTDAAHSSDRAKVELLANTASDLAADNGTH
jgi:hypothetical protein